MSLSLLKAIEDNASRETPPTFTAPDSYEAFLDWLGVVPFPGQRELIRVAYDGRAPTDAKLAASIFGDINLSKAARDVVCHVVGAGGGKTYLLIALRLVYGMLTRDLSIAAPGQRCVALVVAPNDKLRQEAVNYALGACRSKPELKALLRLPRGTSDEDTVSEFGLWRDDFKREVRFEAGVATVGGYGARGRRFTDFALDECAFFRNDTYRVNDADIFAAGSSRVLPGGQSIIASTPWAKSGLLYNTWKANHAKPNTSVLVAHAPTLILNASPITRKMVEREYERDPDNAAREYGAQFVADAGTVFFDPDLIEQACTEEPFELTPRDRVAAGGDFGFRSDSSALVMTALRGDKVHIFDGLECRPEGGKPLKPGVTVEAFVKTIANRCWFVMADGWYREAIAEHLEKHKLTFVGAPALPHETYVRARMLLKEGKLVIHRVPFRARLIQQLSEVTGHATSGGGVSIHHARWATGGHGDLCAAFVLAVWQAVGMTVPETRKEPGTPEWFEEQKEKRRKKMLEAKSKAYWDR